MVDRTLEIERSLVGHFIGEIPPDFDKPVAYVLQRDGLWERRTNPLGTFCHRVAQVRVPGLPRVLEEGFDLSIPRMRTSILWETIAFFRHVYFTLGTEAVVRMIYDKRRKAFETECPKQVVGRAALAFEKRPLPRSKLLVAEVHSHAGMGGSFFSGTDDADEMGDRFYGVVGKLNEALPEVSFRISIGGNKVRIPLNSLFVLEDDPVFSCSFPRKWTDNLYEERRMADGLDEMEQLQLLVREVEE